MAKGAIFRPGRHEGTKAARRSGMDGEGWSFLDHKGTKARRGFLNDEGWMFFRPQRHKGTKEF